MTPHKIYDTPWFFGVMMIVLFIVSYFFWGVLFLGPNRPQGRPERGLHNIVRSTNSQGSSQRGVLPGMGGARRTSGQTPNQGGGLPGGGNNSRINATTR